MASDLSKCAVSTMQSKSDYCGHFNYCNCIAIGHMDSEIMVWRWLVLMLCSRLFGWCLSLHQLKYNVSTRDSNNSTSNARWGKTRRSLMAHWVVRIGGATLCAGRFGKDRSNLKAATNQSLRQTIENCEELILFPRPKGQEKFDPPQSGTVYKISCTNYSFLYYGQTERSLKTRIAEHKRAVCMFDHNSKISCHVYENNHEMDFGISELLDMRLTTTSEFSWKPGFQYRIRNLEMTTLPPQKSTNLWHVRCYLNHAH